MFIQNILLFHYFRLYNCNGQKQTNNVKLFKELFPCRKSSRRYRYVHVSVFGYID